MDIQDRQKDTLTDEKTGIWRDKFFPSRHRDRQVEIRESNRQTVENVRKKSCVEGGAWNGSRMRRKHEEIRRKRGKKKSRRKKKKMKKKKKELMTVETFLRSPSDSIRFSFRRHFEKDVPRLSFDMKSRRGEASKKRRRRKIRKKGEKKKIGRERLKRRRFLIPFSGGRK